MRIVAVHGFNVKDGGKNTVDRFASFIQAAGWEIDVDEGNYGYVHLLSVRLFGRKKRKAVIKTLARAFERADVIITHSNGANYSTKALNKIHGSKVVIHISPALNATTPVPESVSHQLVLSTPYDGWVRLASYLPLHPWGRMGARGYLGDSPKVTNRMDASVKGHSKWFSDAQVTKTWTHCLNFIKESLK